MLTVKGKGRQSSIVSPSNATQKHGHMFERESTKRSTLTARAVARSQASDARLGLLLSMWAGKADGGHMRLVGADEVNGGGKPPGSCLSPPASMTKAATEPNS